MESNKLPPVLQRAIFPATHDRRLIIIVMKVRAFASTLREALLSSMVLFSISHATHAASVGFVIDENDILEWTGDTDTDPRALTALSDGRFVFFEDEPGAGAAEDGAILVDPTQSGNNRFSVIASEDDLLLLAPNGTAANVHVSDIVRDANDNLYLLATERSSGNFDNFVVKIPFDGVSFGLPVLVTDVFDGGNDGSGRVRHRVEVDPIRNRIYILYDNLDMGNETDSGPGSNGVYTFDLGNIPGTTADLAVFASYVDIGAAVTPPVDNGNEETGIWQIRADSQGNLYGVHSSGTGDNDGDIVRIDATDGSVSLFIDQFDAESATGNLNQFTADTNLAIHPANDHLYLFETGTTTEQRENIYAFDSTGGFVGLIAAHDQIVDSLSQAGPTFTTTNSNPIVVDSNGDVYFFLHNSSEVLVAIDSDGVCDPGPSLSFIWPTGSATPPDPSSPFGPRQLASGNFRYDWHRGVDIAMPLGTDLFAVADGIVEKAGDIPGFSEPVVILRHNSCPPYVYSYYLHMSSADVVKEEAVIQGQKVGESGASASGFAHVHYETRVGCNSQSCNSNPYEFLPYPDEEPPLPILTGANPASDQTVLIFDFSVPDSQIDLNGISLNWGADSVTWNWKDYNRANSPSTPSALDRPVINFGSGVYAAAFPDRMNQSSTGANYRVVFAGLDPDATAGTATLSAVHGPGPVQNVAVSMPGVDVCPAAIELSALPGEIITFDHVISNSGSTFLNLDLTVQSANNNSVSLSHNSVSLGPSESQTVTITLTLDSSHPVGIGDGVVLEVDPGSGTKIIALDSVCKDSTCIDPGPPPCSNLPPVADDQSVTTEMNTPVPITLTATDPDADPLTFEVVDPPGSGILTGTAPDLTYTPDSGFTGADFFTFRANDGNTYSNIATVFINVEPPAPVTIAEDGFESNDFSGGSGNWLGAWVTAGDVQIRTDRDNPHSGSSHVRVSKNTGYMERVVDLTSATDGHLTFWAKFKSFRGSDQAFVEVSPDGVNFTTVAVFTSGDSDDTYRFYDIDLAGFPMTDTFHIAFDAEMGSGKGKWYVDDVAITGTPGTPNQPPVAVAGPDQTVSDDDGNGVETVALDGSASFDPDGAIESYEWTEGATVLGSTASVVADFSVGVHTVTLTVTDGGGATGSDDVVITVTGNQAPTADAGSDQTAGDDDGNGVETVTLDGSGSFDPDGTIVSFEWKESSTVLGSTASFSAYFSIGVHTVTLTVTDDDGASDSEVVVVTVGSNQTPTAASGPDQTVTDVDGNGVETVALDGSASFDPDGTIVSFEWKEGTTILGSTASILADLGAGVHTVTLTVTDNGGAASSDEAVITVIDQPSEVVTIIKAEWQAGKKKLKVEVTSSASPDAILTAYWGTDSAQMSYDQKKDKYKLQVSGVTTNPGTVSVSSDHGGSATATVVET